MAGLRPWPTGSEEMTLSEVAPDEAASGKVKTGEATRDETAGELPWDEDRYQAVLRGDPSYDGRFFFAVITTGVFCYPSCSCRKPRRENVRFFADAGAAQGAGFRPCKRCRPDLEGGVRGYEQDLVRQAAALADQVIAPAELARRLAVSPAYLNRLFRRHLNQSTQQYSLWRRVERAARLLEAGLSPLEAAGACGFRSLSAFYPAFRRVYGMAPGEYRGRQHREASEDGVCGL